ncbi:hypothetical protein [Pedobacter cryoconitis]|uniref:hypothetical protein n=1 Tax=Pedobacter cryoconitis TaxID=188932 RepID=UPI00161E896C|nr:hypothetical protein [Pedobacter cryoconitis]MBB5646347.1 hypothetical protein [Pedobacter cryoconitis]
MEYPKKELIKEIADLFEDYQETYVPGEWESFSKVKKKKYPFLANWVRIAAVFVLMGFILAFAFNQFFHQEKAPEIAVIKPTVSKGSEQMAAGSESKTSKGTDQSIKPGQPVLTVQSENRTALNHSKPSGMFKKGEIIEPLNSSEVTAQQATAAVITEKIQPVQQPQELSSQQKKTAEQYAQKQAQPLVVPGVSAKDTTSRNAHEKLTTAEFLLAESRKTNKPLKTKTQQGSDWDFGLQVMPAATSDRMNVGGGVTTAYRISDKFSLSSGISYLQMQAAGEISGQGNSGAGVSTFADKKLVGVDANLKAIDIPIALVYKLNKNFYTSAGVSFFSVLSEKRNNTFEQTAQVDMNGYDFQTGGPSTFKAVSVEHVEEPTVERHLKGNSYLGYFNFSVGRQQNIFNKYKVRIEPFIKIPVGKLSSEDLNLTNSGIKFQLSF